MASVETKPLTEEEVEALPSSIDGVRLAKNTAFNLAGQILPLLAGIALMPYIVRGLGPDRFGMLGITWVVFGYFSLMDFGLGRATTKFLAELLAKGEGGRISEIVWSSLILQLLLGVAGGGVVAILTPILVERVLRIPASLVGEARMAFFMLAFALPAVLVTSAGELNGGVTVREIGLVPTCEFPPNTLPPADVEKANRVPISRAKERVA